jgi:hypothetical protein
LWAIEGSGFENWWWGGSGGAEIDAFVRVGVGWFGCDQRHHGIRISAQERGPDAGPAHAGARG